MESHKLTSPCVRNCCLDKQDICVGCYRHVDEITAWQSANDEQRARILANAQRRRNQHHVKSL